MYRTINRVLELITTEEQIQRARQDRNYNFQCPFQA